MGGGIQQFLEGTLVGGREHWCEVESNNFWREHWWEVESNNFWREHWWETGGNIDVRWNPNNFERRTLVGGGIKQF